MTHYIETGGASARVCADLLKTGKFGRLYIERWGDEETRKKKPASKTRNLASLPIFLIRVESP